MSPQKLYTPIQPELIKVQQRIAEQFESSDPQLAPLLQTIADRQGKMIRPAFVLLCGKMTSAINDEHIDFAAMIELLHMASLLHDDVIDKADLRRGRPSTNALWGNTAAVLLGDFLLSRAFMFAAASKCEGAATLLGQTSRTLCIGELKQNMLKGSFDITEQDYLQLINAKTAALFSCSCQLGAIASGTSADQQQILGQFGQQFGMAFQISDDLSDILSSEKQEGKTLGTDLQQGKFTLPMIHWINQNSDQKQARIQQVKTLKDPAQLIQHMRLNGSIDYATEQVTGRIQQAKALLSTFPDSSAKEALLLFADKGIMAFS